MARDPRVESLLKRGDFKYVYHDREPFANIDLKASAENPARLMRKIDDLTVTKYGCAMLENAVFPAIVLLKQDQDKHLVATGMHRIAAAQEIKRDAFDAYIVAEPDRYRCDLLIRLLNGVEGRGDTIKEQLRHVIALHEQYPKHSLAELALNFNLTRGSVLNAWSTHLGVQRSLRLGFDFDAGGTQEQPQVVIIALNQIPSDLVYTKAAEFISHYRVRGSEVEDLVRELKEVRHKGEGAEIEVVKKHHDAAEERNRRVKARIGKTSPTACTRFIGKCRAVNKQMRRGIEHLHLAALSDLSDASAVVEDAIEHLTQVKAELARIQRMSASGGSSSGLPMAAAPR